MELVKMETAHHHHHHDQLRVLYEASYNGCVSTLNSLIQQDPLILNKINSRTVLIETPLHISASLGHFEFTKALLSRKPKLALELDSFRSTPLHIASAEGHIDIVKALLLAYDEACLVSDREGRIPLHYAVIRGRLEVVREIVRAKPESLKILHRGKTVFHLCVEYDHLEILKVLVEINITKTSELLNFRDLNDGNTILHLVVTFKQVETMRYLLSISEIRDASNLKNHMGLTASDIVDRISKDFRSLEIQIMLINSGIKSEKRKMDSPPQGPVAFHVLDQVPKEKWWRKFLKNVQDWFQHKGDYLEEMRGNLSLVATVISTMTFQVALNPPGSYIQQAISNPNNNTSDPSYNSTVIIYKHTPYKVRDGGGPLGCLRLKDEHNNTNYACPGEAMLAYRMPDDFLRFLTFNSISFFSSLIVTLLLVSGVPLKHRAVIWMLALCMCIALFSLALTYISGLFMTAPDNLLVSMSTGGIFKSYLIWYGLLGLVVVYIIVRFVVWAVTTCMKIIKRCMSMQTWNRDFVKQCALLIFA